jgi:hypothetical protein
MRHLSINLWLLAMLMVTLVEPAWSATISQDDRTLSTVSVPATGRPPLIALSEDRHTLFVANYKSHPGRGGGTAETQLSVLDVSRPEAPRLLTTLPLGDIGFGLLASHHGCLVIKHGWGEQTRPFGIMTVDVTEPNKPAIAANVPVGGVFVDISGDGRFLRTIERDKREHRFKIGPTCKLEDAQEGTDRFEPAEPWRRNIKVEGVQEVVWDQLGSDLLATSPVGLQLWKKIGDTATREVSIALDAHVRDARLLSNTAAIVQLAGPDGVPIRDPIIMSIAPRAFDMDRLKRVYAALRAD